MTSDFGESVRALFQISSRAPSTQIVAAFSYFVCGQDLCNLITEISGISCTYKPLAAVEIPRLKDDIMLDLIPHEAPYTYYMTGFVTTTQLADDKNIEFPLTSFKTSWPSISRAASKFS
jgi:hypothetical protein